MSPRARQAFQSVLKHIVSVKAKQLLCVQLQPPCRTLPGQGNVQHLLPRPRTSPGQGRYKAASARIANPVGGRFSSSASSYARSVTMFSSSRFCCSVITDRDGGTQISNARPELKIAAHKYFDNRNYTKPWRNVTSHFGCL